MAEDLNAMNLDAELLQLESSFIGAQSAKQSLLEALTEANNRLASNALETVRVPDMQEEQVGARPHAGAGWCDPSLILTLATCL